MKPLIIFFVILLIIVIIIYVTTKIKENKEEKKHKKRINDYNEAVKRKEKYLEEYNNNQDEQENDYYQDNKRFNYQKKKSLVTKSELVFYRKLENIFGEDYKIQTQINLASIIDKKESPFRNELFRNVDFGLFDKETFEPIVLIELNDKSHKNKQRYERDLKIREIINEANIPLITFYSFYENKESYIKEKIEEILN